MISVNPQKIMDFFFLIVSAFVVAMAGNYFFDWDFQFALQVGLILGAWSTLYDAVVYFGMKNSLDEDDDEEIEIDERNK